MKPREIAQQYFDAWNARDADAIMQTFVENGTYSDPGVQLLSGQGIGDYAQSLWAAFPDLSFTINSLIESTEGSIAAEWVMTGTNTGSMNGLPPTGKPISLAGIDFIEFEPDGIKALRGYFDTKVIPEQLGLQIIVQPHSIGPFSFGQAIAVQTGNKAKPGAFAITYAGINEDEAEELRELSKDSAVEMLQMDGFIGLRLIRIGGEAYTVSAWEQPDQPKQMMKSPAHKKAMQRYWEDFSHAGHTSVWVPSYFNPMRVRCGSCHNMFDVDQNAGICACGATLPEPPPYF